jgi:hypothetical protein
MERSLRLGALFYVDLFLKMEIKLPLTNLLSKIAGNQIMSKGRNLTRPYDLGFENHLCTLARENVGHFITRPRAKRNKKGNKV